MRTRPASLADRAFIEDMLVEAASWDPARPRLTRDDTLNRPENRHYVEGWPRAGDAGVIVEDDDGEPVGAAWYRVFTADDPGYGFVADDVPEVSIAVVAGRRGQGLGDRLLRALEEEAGRRGVRALSLSVERANPAVRLYHRRGYREVARSDTALTMRLDLVAPSLNAC